MKELSATSAKWRRFVRNPRAFAALVLLGVVFVLSLAGGFFLPDPAAVADPASVAPYRRIRAKVVPEVRAGRLDLRADLTIASATGCAVFSPEIKPGARLADALELPPGFEEAVALRLANRAAPAFAGRSADIELSLLAFAPRESPPRTVRVRLRDAGAASVPPVSLAFNPQPDGGANPTRASRTAFAALCNRLAPPSATNLAAAVSNAAATGGAGATVPLAFADGSAAKAEVSLENVTWPFRPVPGHPMGIDAAGRDVLARVVAGTRIALVFGLVLVVSSMLLGVAAGAVQGYYGGVVDIAAQRFIEIWSSLPFLYVMILVGSVFGRSFILLLFCYGLFNWIGVSYYMRAEFLRLRSRPFVEAARCQGLSPARIIWRHILPNALTPVVTLMPFNLIGAISSISALDFLGFGLPPLTPSLGELLGQAQQNTAAWWLVLYPSLVLFAVMLLSVFVGEGLRDAFDPKPTARYK